MSSFVGTLEQIKVVKLELHEELLKLPHYRAMIALDDLLTIIERAMVDSPTALVPPKPELPKPEPKPEPTPIPKPMPVDAPQPIEVRGKQSSKPFTQVQALLHVLKNKETPATLGWLLAELELLGVTSTALQPRKSLGVVLSSNKELFRRVEYDGGRWMWGLKNRRYPGETTFDHLPATEFKSMKVVSKKTA